MKIILSRKGFDSSAGGHPSPIFPDGRMLSLPIPSRSSAITIADLGYCSGQLGKILNDLTGGTIGPMQRVHLDPDLDPLARPRLKGWRPAFGQTDAAQTHLYNHRVGEGDLFLFFGWFRDVESSDGGGFRYRRRSQNRHVLFGWLQVGEVLRVGDHADRYAKQYPWLRSHPHMQGHWAANSTIYVASEKLILPGHSGSDTPGGGVFPLTKPKLVLTEPDQPNRSLWRLPKWFYPDGNMHPLSYHENPTRWTRTEDGHVRLRSASRGQEFVLDAENRPEINSWISDLFR